ncbi:unnamed protein product [Spirodela intermedia]|uniref:Uncharacterized protein n=1 Tax=Spirodela intermedia TaxID=51605 RepID=A0A7I8L3U3_SPIIN|nr:unnamed protein product [Spirodela intermedia]
MGGADLLAWSPCGLRWTILPRRLRGGARGRHLSSSGFRFSPSSASSSANNGESSSYLEMWKKAMERERSSQELIWIATRPSNDGWGRQEEGGDRKSSVDRMTDQFNRILEVPKEERDRVQRLQVIDRAAAAIAAARALIKEPPPSKQPSTSSLSSDGSHASAEYSGSGLLAPEGEKMENASIESGSLSHIAPGPDFWSWSPPENIHSLNNAQLQPLSKASSFPKPTISVMEKENSEEILSIPFQSTLPQSKHAPLPPLQSLVEVEAEIVDYPLSTSEPLPSTEKKEHDELSSRNALEAAEALAATVETSSQGVNPDGSKWWKESGVEERQNGVVCKWTLTRGVSADGAVEWEDKFWEAADEFDHKELGSEKSGRDSAGNVWREYWKETISQDLSCGAFHIEKTADKWGKNGAGDEWHEKWWEHYDATGQTEKWAHKWCSIDPTTPLDAGHAHVWHERWGEKYDGDGGSSKYTDKWAERSVGDGWAKWGDKWDEDFDKYGNGVKQGETWWAGEYGHRWNRTWGEHHNGSGWIHKYGKSSSGEHWDTHVKQDTWYEKYPHYGFSHCLRNSVQLLAVRKSTPPTP